MFVLRKTYLGSKIIYAFGFRRIMFKYENQLQVNIKSIYNINEYILNRLRDYHIIYFLYLHLF